MSLIRMWGAKHGIGAAALAELENLMGIAGTSALTDPTAQGEPGSESRQQSLIRLAAAKRDILLFRNNVGGAMLDNGSFIRFGLANDSDKMNDNIKSSDLIGIERVTVTPQMVGGTLGVFTALECKRLDWKFRPSDKHSAKQKVFIDLINAYGGRAKFIQRPEDL